MIKILAIAVALSFVGVSFATADCGGGCGKGDGKKDGDKKEVVALRD